MKKMIEHYIPIVEKLMELPQETEIQDSFKFDCVRDAVLNMLNHTGELRDTYLSVWVKSFFMDDMLSLYNQIKKDAGL